MKYLLALLLLVLPSLTEAASVTWVCDRCTPAVGTATGTAAWSVSNVTLAVGLNHITVIATDDNNNTSSDTITVTYAPTFPGNTLAGAWGLEAGSGTTTADSSGNNNTATLVNGPTWLVPGGRYGNALSFDGLTQSLDVPDVNSLDFTQSFTLSAWINPAAVQSDFRSVISKSSDPTAHPYDLFASTQDFFCPTTGAGSIAAAVNTNGVLGPRFAVCAPPAPINQWTHIAATYDGANLRLYVNGIEAAGSPVPATGYIEPSAGALVLGDSEYSEAFNGILDEVRVYNYAIPLSAGSNTVFGAACDRASETATPSIIGDANCSVVPPANILAIKFPSSATGFKVGAGATLLKFGSR